jgi:purine-binding chemotaxis protein CheW
MEAVLSPPENNMNHAQQSDVTAEARDYLSFRLGAEEYAIDILKVQEIRGYDHVTRIANTPAFIKGVINLRGHIAPIVDLRIKFELGVVEYDQFTVVIVLSLKDRVVGIVVDSVSDVITLGAADIRPAPEFAATINTAFIEGLASLEERMIIIADIEQLMSGEDMALVQPLQDAA